MLTWCCTFFERTYRHQRLSLVLAVSLNITAVSAAVPGAGSCNSSPVFALSKALFYGQYAKAEEALVSIDLQRRPEIGLFLRQVMRFKRAYDEEDRGVLENALRQIDDQLEMISSDSGSAKELEAILTRANIMIHASRMHLALGNVFRAARLAREGRELLDQVLARDPLHPDALLTDGLYYYYTGSGEESLDWAMTLFGLSGERYRGIEKMEQAIARSPDHAFEALRSLLVDVSWNRNDTCRYAALIAIQEMPAVRIFEPHGVRIAASLFCGKPGDALEHLSQLRQAPTDSGLSLSEAQQGWLFEARLHALAALGASVQLQQLAAEHSDSSAKRKALIRFALAKAMDIRGEHAQAVPLYQQVLSSGLNDGYRRLARVYSDKPYQAPRKFDNTPVPALQFACGDGTGYED